MLKMILFALSPKVAKTHSVQAFLQVLKQAEIDFVLYGTPSSISTYSEKSSHSIITSYAGFSSEECLVITDTASGVSSAQTANLPCIGYTPPGHCEDLSGAYALFEDFASIDMGYLCRTHAHAIGYPAEILTTDRLMVRELSETDFPALYAMCTSPETAPFMDDMLSDFETEREKHIAYLRNVYPFFDLALWGVFEKDSGRLIGRAGFSLPEEDDHTFSLGYLIAVPHRRQGYAKELVPSLLSYAKEQGYSKISVKIKKDNIASQRTLTRCGFPYDYDENPEHGMYTYTIYLTM